MSLFEQFLKGRVLRGRYRLDAMLGQGGMGAVFRATDLQLERAVAVKVISFREGSPELHDMLRSRFRREARLAAQLRHPNVVQTYDFGTDDELGLEFLVMELLPGIDLREYLAQRGPPPPHDAYMMLLQAARGIAAGHRARPRLIHRDVKPANLFLADAEDDDMRRVVVLDFGIALPDGDDHTVTRLTMAAVGPLSRLYAAPEQLEGRSLTPACDVFSLGVTGFELFTGKPLAQGEAGTARAIHDMQEWLAVHADRFPDGVAAVLRKALALRPEDRFHDAAALVQALQAAPGASPPPHDPTPTDPPLRLARRSILGIPLALAAGALTFLIPLPRPASSGSAGQADSTTVPGTDTTAVVAPAAVDTSMPSVTSTPLSNALGKLSPAVLARIREAGYYTAGVLVDASFDRDTVFEDSPGGIYYAYRGGRAYLSTREPGRNPGYGWNVAHRNVVVRVLLRYESGPGHSNAGLDIRDGISIWVMATPSETPSFSIQNLVGRGWNVVVPWTPFNGTVDNMLEVVATGGTMFVYINGTLVYTWSGMLDRPGTRIDLTSGVPGATYSFDDFVAVSLELDPIAGGGEKM